MENLFKKSALFIILLLIFTFFYEIYFKDLIKKDRPFGQKEFIDRSKIIQKDQFGELIPFIASKIEPCVVSIKTEATRNKRMLLFENFLKQKITKGGSGIIISNTGHIITNVHVIDNAKKITVIFNDKKEASATIVGIDSLTDLAVIKTNPKKNMKPAVFGNSDDLRQGQWVLAIGSPLGLFNSVTFGIISALGRESLFTSEMYEDFIQTDAAINSGNSGGPLINLNGEVIGINTSIMSPSGDNVGIGFAIPSNIAKKVATSIISKGYVKRGWLGIEMQSIDKNIADAIGLNSTDGAMVVSVIKNSPADKADIKSGDVIIKYRGKKIETIHDLRNMVAFTNPNQNVSITIIRNKKEKKIHVKIKEKNRKDIFEKLKEFYKNKREK